MVACRPFSKGVRPPLRDVRALVGALRAAGVDADADLYHFILVIVGPAWRAAWEGRADPTRSAGAAAETDVAPAVDQQAGYSRSSLTIHCLPLPSSAIPAREIPGLGRSLVTAVRASGLVADDIALPLDEVRSSVCVRAGLPRRDYRAVVPRGAFECLLVSTETGQRSVSRELPGDSMGTVVDAGVVEVDLVDALFLVARTLSGPSTMAIAAEIGPTELITDGTVATLGRSSATMLKTGRGPLLREPMKPSR